VNRGRLVRRIRRALSLRANVVVAESPVCSAFGHSASRSSPPRSMRRVSTPARIRGASVAGVPSGHWSRDSSSHIRHTFGSCPGGGHGAGLFFFARPLRDPPRPRVPDPRCFRLPDTPRWYVLKGQTERAVEGSCHEPGPGTSIRAGGRPPVVGIRDSPRRAARDSGPRSLLAPKGRNARAGILRRRGLGSSARIHRHQCRDVLQGPQILRGRMGFTGNGQELHLLPVLGSSSPQTGRRPVSPSFIIDRISARRVLLIVRESHDVSR